MGEKSNYPQQHGKSQFTRQWFTVIPDLIEDPGAINLSQVSGFPL